MRNPDWPPLDPNDYEDTEIDDEDNPELTEEDFARAVPLKDLLPDLHARLTQGGPLRAGPVRSVTLDLDPEVVAVFEARGPDWRDRMREALAQAAERVKEEV